MVSRMWLGVVLAVAAHAADPSLTFEVATVKASPPPNTVDGKRIIRAGPQGGPGTSDPGQISFSFVNMKNLLMTAFGVKAYQISGPAWLDTERYDIVAKIPPGATKDDVKIMLQNLLKERFQLAVHRETKEMAVFELVVAKDGPKLKESADQSDPEAAPRPGTPGEGGPSAEAPPPPGPPDPSKIKMGKDGMPEIPAALRRPGVMMMAMMSPTGARMKLDGNRATISQLIDTLANQSDRPILDKTGLTARYDFTLDFAPDQGAMTAKMGALGPPPPPPPGGGPGPGAGLGGGDLGPHPETDALPLQAAIQKQIGLRLEAKKDSVDLLVIDHIEKTPTEN